MSAYFTSPSKTAPNTFVDQLFDWKTTQPKKFKSASTGILARPDTPNDAPRVPELSARWCEIGVPLADLKIEPNDNARIETQALYGDAVRVLCTIGDYHHVELRYDGCVGYVKDSFLRPQSPPATHRVTAPLTFVYPCLSFKSKPIATLPMNARVHIIEEHEKYMRFTEGFVHREHLASVDFREVDWVEVAERFMTSPYLWGGITALGIDCSGLVQAALRAASITAPRNAAEQERSLGWAIPKDSMLSRGDLLFWRGHIGIMRDSQTLLHANATTMLVSSENIDLVRQRYSQNGAGDVTSVRRL
jgi:cell wall-associated NlpC family hydrolase